MVERGGKSRLLEDGALVRRLTVGQKGLHETRRGFQLGIFLAGQRRLAARHRIAFARAPDRGVEQHVQRQPARTFIDAFAGLRFGRFQRQHPTGDRARHRQRGERPARRNFVMTGVAIKPRRRLRAGNACAHNRAHPAVGFADQPEAVAADMVHVRIDRGDRRRHRQHRLDGVAAFGQDGAAVLDGG